MRRLLSSIVSVMLSVSACSDDDGAADSGASPTDGGRADTGPGGRDGSIPSDAETHADSSVEPPAEVCAALEPYDVSAPTAVVGTGTPESCTEAMLRAAATAGGTITFDCGDAPVTIEITEQITLPVDRDTIIDGGDLVTLDAGHRVRIFYFEHPSWMDNQNMVALQRITLRNGQAPLGEYFDQDMDRPACAYGYKDGSGGAIFMRNGVLHVIDAAFYDNHAALIGPDVGGGAIYVLGAVELIVSGSRFAGNRGSNAGAIGLLFSGNAAIYDSIFENNTAEGRGANSVEPGCPNFNHEEQGGAGGNGGAVTFDGLNDEGNVYTFCGAVFRSNRANELGGALFRTPNAGQRQMLIDRSTFDGNTARLGGVSFIKQNDVTVRGSTFMNNRGGVDIEGTPADVAILGGLWVTDGTTSIENSTFAHNIPTGLNVDPSATVRNATFVDSRVEGSVTFDNCLFVDTRCNESSPGSHNLQWPMGDPCAGDTSFADPMLGDVGDNGGPTPTALPGAAVSGVGMGCPATDQRGEPRTMASCAAGAVEP